MQNTWIAFCQQKHFTLLAGAFAGSTPSIETNHQAILGSCRCRDACNTVSRIVRRKKCAVHHALRSRRNRLGGSGVRAKNGVVGNGVHVHVFQSAAPERCNGPIIGFTLIIFQFMLVMTCIHDMNKLPHKPCCFPMPWPEPCPPRLQPWCWTLSTCWRTKEPVRALATFLLFGPNPWRSAGKPSEYVHLRVYDGEYVWLARAPPFACASHSRYSRALLRAARQASQRASKPCFAAAPGAKLATWSATSKIENRVLCTARSETGEGALE